MIFGHVPPWTETMTFQALMAAPLPDTLPADARAKYTIACGSLLTSLGAAARNEVWEDLVATLSKLLLDMLGVLVDANAVRRFLFGSRTRWVSLPEQVF
jgi:hypothetical protein